MVLSRNTKCWIQSNMKIQEDDEEVSILKVESEEGDDLELVTCEDDVIEEVYHIFKENNTDNFDFED